jgi:acyl-CoA thioesterase YciA
MSNPVNMKRHLPAVRVSMFPKDTNATGKNIFGGVILSHMDTAGGIAARRVCASNVVTITFEKVVFKQPVHIGDILTCWAEVTEIGRSSMHVSILVEVERKGVTIHVTEGSAVFVAVDEEGNSIPIVGWNGKRPRRKKSKPASSAVCASPTTHTA